MADTGLFNTVYNPDVLTCLANLSNDEVFTPPDIANAMLDMLPQELFRNPDTKFLDPACKSGVFLREIAKRLIVGLEPQFPDLQERIDHIMHHQLYGIAITELTAMLSRRSLYCTKYPENDEFSVSVFDKNHAGGNILYRRIQHTWKDGKCIYCGASKSQYQRADDLETHAYEWIHTHAPEEIFKMKFDVIISNPPYQLSDGGNAASAMPIYQKFVENAQKLAPNYLTMIIPSRWFTGGRGLDNFRNQMLHDKQIREIHDFPDASDVFPGVEIKGGVCYFLWERGTSGDCIISTHKSDKEYRSVRPLLEPGMETFIRNVAQISVLKKVQAAGERPFTDILSANDPFGFDVREDNSYRRKRAPYEYSPFSNSVKYYYNGWRKDGVGYVDRSYIRKGLDLVDKYKVFVPRVWGSGNPETDWVHPFVVSPNSCCTETYLAIGPFEDELTGENAISYMQTKFFHFLIALIKNTQQAMKKVYTFVPLQDFSKPWTDEELYAKYNLTDEEIAFIDSMIRPMDTSGGDE